MLRFDPRSILQSPTVYQLFQRMGGFFRLRLTAWNEYLPIKEGDRIFDIGCGPGHIIEHLPRGIDYHGFDTAASYIDFANRKFGARGKFHCEVFDATAKDKYGPADVVTLNALIHHLSDDAAGRLFADVHACLKPGGLLFTLDPCFREGQSPIARWIHANDRGEFVRTEPEYRALLSRSFPDVQTHIREDISVVPQTIFISISRK